MRMWVGWLICLLFCFWDIKAKQTFSQGLREPIVDEDIELPKAQWFDQKLDHFDPTDSRTWKQRFFVNESFHMPGGPLFLMIGGEGPASAKWMVTGAWSVYAKEFNASMVQLEHRFYGESHPTKDVSTSNLRYLTSQQALADLAYFVDEFKTKRNMSASKVIAFGGSYPGSLASWFRIKYPHVVHASISSSAPLIAKVDFKEYLEVVHDSLLSKGSLQCIIGISKATTKLRALLSYKYGGKWIEKVFKLCSPLDVNNTNDVSTLFAALADNFEGVVQYNEDNRAFEGAIGTNITIKTVCDIMSQKSKGSLRKFGEVNSLMLRIQGEKCLDHTYQSVIEGMKKTKWTDNVGARTWTYQTCTEFGFYQTTASYDQPFGHNFPLEYFIQQCRDVFGDRFNKTLVDEGVKRTNIMYGGQHPSMSRVVLINGSIDPWHKLGVIKSLSKDVPAIFINGTAHCANMYPEQMEDSQDLKAARIKINDYIGKWLEQ